MRVVLSRICDGALFPTIADRVGPSVAWHLAKLWQLRGDFTHGANWATTIAQRTSSRTGNLALCLDMAACFQLWTGHVELAHTLVERAMQLSDQLENSEALAWSR